LGFTLESFLTENMQHRIEIVNFIDIKCITRNSSQQVVSANAQGVPGFNH